MRRTAFTLLEVLMASVAGFMLIAVIYFFYFGMLGGQRNAQDQLELNRFSEATMEAIAHDLRMTYQINALKADRMQVSRVLPEGFSGEGFAPEDLKLQTVEYKLEMLNDSAGRPHACLTRRLDFDQPAPLFSVDACDKEVFSGMVLDMPREKGDPFPRFHMFDMVGEPSGDLPRITMIRIHLAMVQGKEHFAIQTKFFLPIAYGKTVQAEWNVE